MFKKLRGLFRDDEEELISQILKQEPDLRTIGLFAELEAEKIAEISHALIYLNELNHMDPDPKTHQPILFYLSTYGGNADDMFALYDLMRIVRDCRVMLHAVMGGNQGSLHDMINEMGAIENLQEMYIDCLVSETKLTKSKLKKMLERKVNIYLSAEEAVEYGIADVIV